MSFISHDLKGAVVTWKDDNYEHCNGGPWDWPFKEDVTQATVVGVWVNTESGVHYNSVMLVLKAPNGDLAHFVGNGARVIEGGVIEGGVIEGGVSEDCVTTMPSMEYWRDLEKRIGELERGSSSDRD